jgi:hypothetical protein
MDTSRPNIRDKTGINRTSLFEYIVIGKTISPHEIVNRHPLFTLKLDILHIDVTIRRGYLKPRFHKLSDLTGLFFPGGEGTGDGMKNLQFFVPEKRVSPGRE